MRPFVFFAEFERGDKRGIVVSFPDVPEAIAQGDDMADARRRPKRRSGSHCSAIRSAASLAARENPPTGSDANCRPP